MGVYDTRVLRVQNLLSGTMIEPFGSKILVGFSTWSNFPFLHVPRALAFEEIFLKTLLKSSWYFPFGLLQQYNFSQVCCRENVLIFHRMQKFCLEGYRIQRQFSESTFIFSGESIHVNHIFSKKPSRRLTLALNHCIFHYHPLTETAALSGESEY